MKSIKIAALLLTSSAFVYAQEITVKGNTKLNTDFSKYKTYTWAKTDKTMPAKGDYEIYSYSEEVAAPQTTITTTHSKASSKKNDNKTTTKKVETRKPDNYIYSYSVIIPAPDASINSTIQSSISEELEGRGYRKSDSNGDLIVSYKVLDRNGKIRGYINDNPTVVNSSEVREPQDTTTYFTKPGTLMISLIDAKNSQVVWDGFASGLVQNNEFVADPIKVEEAVHLIFAEFKYRANKLTTSK